MGKKTTKQRSNRPPTTSKRPGKPGTATAAQRAMRDARGQRWWTRWWVFAAVIVVVIGAIAAGVTVSYQDKKAATANAPTSVPPQPIRTATGRQTPPPWPAPADATAAVHKAGLPMLSSEGAVEHIHAHLDVIVNGKQVPVPAGIGVDRQAGSISPLHTHDDSGVIHIESPEKVPFSMGQLFTEWQVALSGKHIGGLQAGQGKTLRAYVNGKPVSGNPAAITIGAHDEIALVYGKAGATPKIPKSYDFPQGE